MSEKCSSGRLTTFLAGAAAGAVFAFLTTPKTGRENRRIIGELGEKFFDEIQERYDVDGEDLKEKGRDLIDRGREIMAEKREELNLAIKAGREAMEKEKEELAKTMDPDFTED